MVVIGLKKRDTFEEVVEYIKNPTDVIKFPDRYAKQIRNSFELSQLDGAGMMEYEQHELQTMKETEKANTLRKVARDADDTSHVEFKAHAEQSRPPVNTSTTTQASQTLNASTTTQASQTNPADKVNTSTHTTQTEYHKIYTDDEMTEEVGRLKSQYQAQADKLREEAEVEHKVLENRHKQKISNLVNQHSNEMADLTNHHEAKHHTAQALLQREMNMKSQSQQQMFEQQARIQEQRHQAEMANQKKKFESQLREQRRPVVEEPKEKRRVTRSMAAETQTNFHEMEKEPPIPNEPPPMPPPGDPKVGGKGFKASEGVKFPYDDKTREPAGHRGSEGIKFPYDDKTREPAGHRGAEGIKSETAPPKSKSTQSAKPSAQSAQPKSAKPASTQNAKPNAQSAQPKSAPTKTSGVKPNPVFTKSSSGATSSQNPQGSSASQPASSSHPTHTAHAQIDGKSRTWWAKQNIQQIKAQCEIRGRRFTDIETKGKVKGSTKTYPKFKKQDYLNELYKLLGI